MFRGLVVILQSAVVQLLNKSKIESSSAAEEVSADDCDFHGN